MISTETLTASLLEAYQTTRRRSETMCRPLSPEDCVPQPVEFASPPKWHLAHTTWFFEEMILRPNLPDYEVFDDQFSYLFNSYYNTLGQRIERAHRGVITRPGIDRVYTYRRYVDEHMEQLLNMGVGENVEELVTLGVQHEQQHQELLLTDLKHTFSLNPAYPVYSEKILVDNVNKESGWHSISEGVYEIGYQGDGFCFDNELGRHKVYLHHAKISKALVTNGEFMEFIDEGGYRRPELWLDEGWAWVQDNNVTKPQYWHSKDGQWYHYTLGGLQEVHAKSILSHISFYEASAYAAFRKLRLPTEFEWEAASGSIQWGKRWEWTNSAYLPYPGFQIKEGAVGEYNGKFMCNQMVLRGASSATSPGHSRATYRNFFHPHLRWQFTGIRLAQ